MNTPSTSAAARVSDDGTALRLMVASCAQLAERYIGLVKFAFS
jgi:hypothetical protein